mmetsp:Transcript_66309/g.156094  ORF Transcript_66309/g.156094 Transcript_66309/m.156094 type:complete len:357 (+) Transcript_66309:3-1073(+)
MFVTSATAKDGLFKPSAKAWTRLGASGLGEIDWALARDDAFCLCHVLALGPVGDLLLLFLADLFLGLRRSLEDLLGPSGGTGVKHILDHELDPLAVGALAVLCLALHEVFQSAAHRGKCRLARNHVLHGVTDGQQKLASALKGMLLGEIVNLLAQHELAHDASDHLCRQQLSQKEVANELHVGAHTVLALLAHVLQILEVQLCLLFLCQIPGGQQFFKFILANVQHEALKSNRLATIRAGEGRIHRLQAEHHVCVRLAVVGLGNGLLEHQLDNRLQLLDVLDFDGCDLLDDRRHVFRADLVQQALDLTLHVLFRRLHLLGSRTPGIGGDREGRSRLLHRSPLDKCGGLASHPMVAL